MRKVRFFVIPEIPARVEREDELLKNAFACGRTAMANALVYRAEHQMDASVQSKFR